MKAVKFSLRSTQKEYLDDLACEGADLDQNLRELRFINHWLGGNNVTLSGLTLALEKHNHANRLHLVDLGCGGGDILLLIEKWAASRGLSLELTGVDANANIIRYAQARTLHKPAIRYLVENIFSDEFATRKFDLVNATLFCHHFTTEELTGLLSQLKNQTRIAIVINDLHRHPFAYYSIAWLTHFFSKSYMVKHDAKLSVLRGFSKKELISIITKAGFAKYKLRWKWAFRWEVVLYC